MRMKGPRVGIFSYFLFMDQKAKVREKKADS